MTEPSAGTRSVVVERELPFAPEKIWRALTQPHLIDEWLMKNDFKPVVDHRFSLRADWGAVDLKRDEQRMTDAAAREDDCGGHDVSQRKEWEAK